MKKNLSKHFLTQLSFFVTLLLSVFLTILFPDITRLLAFILVVATIAYQWLLPQANTKKRFGITWHLPLKWALFIITFSQGVLLYEEMYPSLAAKFATQETEILPKKTEQTIDSEILMDESVVAEENDTQQPNITKSPEIQNQTNLKVATLQRVVDGNSLYLTVNGQTIKARLLLIDSLSTVDSSLAEQAQERLTELVINAAQLHISYDESLSTSDRYGQASIYLWADGELVQKTLLQEGLATISENDSYDASYLTEMEQAQEHAQSSQIGIWAKQTNTTVYPDIDQATREDRSDTTTHFDENEPFSEEPDYYNNRTNQENTRDSYDSFEHWSQENNNSRRNYSYR